MKLTPEETAKDFLTLATAKDALTFKIPENMNMVRLQFSAKGASSWTAGAVVTVEVWQDGGVPADFTAGAVTYTSVGNKDPLIVEGFNRLRVRVSTLAAGTDEIYVSLNGWKAA